MASATRLLGRRLLAGGAASALAGSVYASATSQSSQSDSSPSSKLARTASVFYPDDQSKPEQAWSAPKRDTVKAALKQEEFDILVIGGGATGTGVAMDASTRGLNVALVERDDFASGTSSRSTKLIHGGFRYLAQAFQAKLPPNSIFDIIWNLRYRHEYMKILNADLYERCALFSLARRASVRPPSPRLLHLYFFL